MQLPNARQEGLIVEELAGETLVYDLESHKAHSLNPTAALVWRCCKDSRSVGDAAKKLQKDLRAPNSEELVLLAVERLRSARLLDDDTPRLGKEISRRAAMKKLALVGSLSLLLPVVHSIVAPTPAQAQTCINPGGAPPGTPCSNNNQCCTNICDQFTLTCL